MSGPDVVRRGGVGETVVSGWTVATGAADPTRQVALVDLAGAGVAVARRPADPRTRGVALREGDRAFVTSFGPGETTVVGVTRDDAVQLATRLADPARIFDLSSGRSIVRLAGEGADRILARLTTLPLAPASFPNGSAARGSVAAVTVAVVRLDRGDTLSYVLVTPRASGRYFCEVLLEAGHDLGADWGDPAMGFDGLGALGPRSSTEFEVDEGVT